jgi:hypothetical protein
MSNRKERRRTRRVTSRFPMRYRTIPVTDAGYLDARVEDVSPEGVRFRCAEGIRLRAGLLFELQIPGAPPACSFGRAAWVRELPGAAGYEVGSAFVDQSTATRKRIERHIQA